MPPSHTKLLYYVLVCIGIVNITTLWLPAEQNSKRAQAVTRSVLPRVSWQSPTTQQRNPFMQVHVLTMTRAQSLQRLLQSLQDARYDGALVNLTIHVDHHANNRACIQVAEDFQFAHGSKHILISDTAHGLRDAWFNAWRPSVEYIERAIILEDDIMLSPLWYVWLSAAWDAYQGRDDLAGISLQRQAFVHKIDAENFEIVNNHVPFLYASVGSIGFSPHWRQWRNFLAWVKSVDVSTVDVHVPGLKTSQWFAHQDRRKMWTQYFIWFCEQKQLMTLFVNIPGARALASHMREAGVHHGKGLAPDFPVATATTSSNWEFPPRPFQYGWDAKLLHDSVCTNIAQSLPWENTAIPTCNQHVLEQALQIQRQHEFVNIQFLNQGFINMTKSWLCNIRQFPGVEERTLFITTDPESFYAISSFTQQARVVLLPYATDTTLRYGQHAYFEYMMFRSNIILFLLQQNVTIWLTEADAVWFRDPTTAVSSSTADYVTMNDETPPKKMVQGGFQFLRPSTATISIWSRMIPVLQNKLNLNFLFALFDWSTEQAMLSDLLKATGQPKVEWLNAHRFVSGIYYKNAKNYKDPIVVLNNWIRGIDAKTARAKRWGHWFLGEDGTCLHTRSRDQSIQPLQRQLVTDGTAYGGWTYDQSQLHAASVVYSVGLGEDTSWDETLIRRFHLQVWGFDPTPKSAAYVRSRRQLPLEHFHFTAEGLSVRSGNLTFTKPANSNHVSMREGEHAGGGEKIQVPVNTLQNWMKNFGHARIDLLRLDIEGSEYDVLQDWIDSAWFPISQLLVEFHFHAAKDHLRHLVIVKALKRHGFDVMYEKTEKETKMGFVRRPSLLPGLSDLSQCKNSRKVLDVMMSAKEQIFLSSYMTPTTRYFEWGSGGSTDTYARLTEATVVSIENFKPWCDKVADLPLVKCKQKNKTLQFKCIIPHATGPFGYPINATNNNDFAEYFNAITKHPNFDVVLIDGRWRVACALISLDYIKDSTVVFMHDVSDEPSRKVYKSVYKWYDVIAQEGTLVAMRRKKDTQRPSMQELRQWQMRPEC